MSLTGGQTTKSKHRIGLTDDQMTDFKNKVVEAVREINADGGQTPEQKRELIKNLPTMKDEGFYHFLNTQYKTGPQVAEYIRQFISENRPKHAAGPKGTKKTKVIE